MGRFSMGLNKITTLWPNRDPIAEAGSEVLWSGLPLLASPGELREGPNLYEYVMDDAIDYVDSDGRGRWS